MTTVKNIGFYFFVAGVFACAPYFAYQYFIDEPMTVALNDREPNSIQKVYDYSDLVGNALQAAAKDRLVNSIQITANSGDILIQMGNFVLLNDNKQKDFACGYYNQMSFEFVADGVLVEGEMPTLTMKTGCDVAANINFMTPFKVPVNQLKSQKPNQTEFKFFDSGRTITLTMNHSPAEWPSTWTLKNIKMNHTQFSSRLLQIPTTGPDMDTHKQISMKW